VIVTEPVSRRAELAREMGADHVLDPTEGNVGGVLLELTGSVGPDVVFE
jgi:(R,R)-butanediol dehydrogenase/meso-butanediol dehydrogenase/diacetyl reductase